MASGFRLWVGPLSSERTFANESKVRDVLLKYYDVRGLAPQDENGNPISQTNQEKLDAVRDDLLDHVISTVKNHRIQEERTEALAGIEDIVEDEVDFRKVAT